MVSFVFDTHQAVKDLENAGANEKLAEAVVATIGTAISDQVATKADIKDVRADMKDIRAEIVHLKKDLTIRLGVMLFAGLATMTTILQVFK